MNATGVGDWRGDRENANWGGGPICDGSVRGPRVGECGGRLCTV